MVVTGYCYECELVISILAQKTTLTMRWSVDTDPPLVLDANPNWWDKEYLIGQLLHNSEEFVGLVCTDYSIHAMASVSLHSVTSDLWPSVASLTLFKVILWHDVATIFWHSIVTIYWHISVTLWQVCWWWGVVPSLRSLCAVLYSFHLTYQKIRRCDGTQVVSCLSR